MRIFKEEQRFIQSWLIILIVVSMITPTVIILKQSESMSSLQIISFISIVILSSSLIFIFKLTTRIDEVGIHYKFFPFHFKMKIIKWTEINNAYVRTYDPIGEYGGWGLKGGYFWKKNKGTAINVSGDIGIQLELKNGKKILIGTKKENDSKSVIRTYETKFKDN